MIFGKKKRPLLSCKILHQLPGRIRIESRALKFLDNRRVNIQEHLESMAGIASAKCTPLTENLLIYFDPEIISEHDLLDLTESIVGNYSLEALKAERDEQVKNTVKERRLGEEPISELASRILTAGVSLLFSYLRKGTQPTTFLGSLFSSATITSISLSIPIVKSGWDSMVRARRPNADTLSAAAIFASLLAGRGTSSLTIILLADIAELLTAFTMEQTRKAISKMLPVGEEMVWRLNEDGSEEQVSITELDKGDKILVNAGEKISVDGTVVSGDALVDQSSITGEFIPARTVAESKVFAGTVLKSGSLTVEALKVGDQTAVSRIIKMVEEATHKKAAVQAYADKFSAQFIPVNFALALLVFALTGKTTRALNMLIIDYSCGVRLSTATALSAAICASAAQGVLIKGSNYLEMLNDADTLIMDKTGTLTEGRPQVTSVVPLSSKTTEKEIIQLAAAAEATSSHPIAAAIMEKARRSGWKVPKHTNSATHVALGMETRVHGSTIRVGSRRYMENSGIETNHAVEDSSKLARMGENINYVAKGNKLLGIIGVHDALRENMKKSLNRLRHHGMDDIILLTGDVEQHAEIVASRMAMDSYHAEVLPEDKAETVLKLQSRNARVVMVGDGVNDAPALAYADVGIAMGNTRTDIAMEAADITITHDDPLLIPAVIRLARNTMKIIRQNFAASIGINSAGLVLSALGILPVFWGAVLHNATTVAVVINSSRLLLHDFESRG